MLRLRVCYRKTGRLRFLSHLEVCRALERGVRRAGLPVAYTQGFSPKVKLAFGPALPVGFGGMREYVDIWLQRHLPPAEVEARLTPCLHPELGVQEAGFVAPKDRSLAATVAVAAYRVEYVGLSVDSMGLLERGLARLIQAGSITVDTRKGPRTHGLTAAFSRPPRLLREEDGLGTSVAIEEWLRLQDQAPVRPDAVASEVATLVEGPFYPRVTRLECYAERDGELVSVGEVR